MKNKRVSAVLGVSNCPVLSPAQAVYRSQSAQSIIKAPGEEGSISQCLPCDSKSLLMRISDDSTLSTFIYCQETLCF